MKRFVALAVLLMSMLTPYALAAAIPGTLSGWGNNFYQQTDVPSGSDYTAISAASFHTVGLRADGSIVAWGANWSIPAVFNVPAGNDYKAVSAAFTHSVALKQDGSLVAWGDDSWGETAVPAGNDFVSVSANRAHNVAQRADGSLVEWGYYWGQPTPGGTDYLDAKAGDSFSVALKSDGSLLAWGANNFGQLDVPPGNDFVAIAAGEHYGFALRSDGSLAAWGSFITPVFYTPFPAIAPAGNDFAVLSTYAGHMVALKTDGTLVEWYSNDFGSMAVVTNDPHLVAFSAGGDFGIAIFAVPEPSGWTLATLAMMGLAWTARKRLRA